MTQRILPKRAALIDAFGEERTMLDLTRRLLPLALAVGLLSAAPSPAEAAAPVGASVQTVQYYGGYGGRGYYGRRRFYGYGRPRFMDGLASTGRVATVAATTEDTGLAMAVAASGDPAGDCRRPMIAPTLSPAPAPVPPYPVPDDDLEPPAPVVDPPIDPMPEPAPLV